MRHNKKAFTLVEMLVALAVSSIIVAATFASFELIQKQYKKNIDVAELHTSGRSIMSILEREIRMAGYEFRDDKGLMTYGKISSPLVIIDSGNKCCDEVTIIYDEVFDTLNASGVVTSSTVERVKTRFWTEPYNSNKRGSRHRLYKRRTILGTNNALLAMPRVGAKEIMADYIDDLQIVNIITSVALYVGSASNYVDIANPIDKKVVDIIGGFGNRTNAGMAYGDDYLYVGTASTYVEKVDSEKKSIVGTIGGFGNRTNAGMAYGDGRLYVGTASNYVEVVDPVRKTIVGTIGGFGNRTNAGMAYGDGRLYVGTASNYVEVVDPVRKTIVGTIGGFGNRTNAGMAYGDGRLYVGTASNYVEVVDPVRKKIDGTISGFTHRTNAGMAYGNGLLYVGTSSNYVEIVDPVRKKLIGTIGSFAGRTNAGMAFKIKKSGTTSVVSIDMTLRTKEKYGKSRQFLKKDYFNGNFNFNKNDQFFRDTFSTTVSVRNL